MAIDSEAGAQRVHDALYRRDVALARHRGVLADRLGITGTELLALVHLLQRGELAPSGLAQVLDLSSAGATALAQRLVGGGHATRHRHPSDRRMTLLRPTRRSAAALAPLRGGLDALTASLGGEQQATVAAFLAELAGLHERLAAGTPAGRDLARPLPSLWG